MNAIDTRALSSVEAYLTWIAQRDGVEIPDDAHFAADGMWSGRGKSAVLIIAMPGYGASDIVTMETLDEAGAVIRSQSVTDTRRGGISLKADQVLQATGLTKGRKPRAAARPHKLDPVAALRMTAEQIRDYLASCRPVSVEVEAIAAPVESAATPAPLPNTTLIIEGLTERVEPAPAPSPIGLTGSEALLARIAKLENAVDTLLLYALDAASPPAVEMVATPSRGNDEATARLPSDPRARAVVAIRDDRAEKRVRSDKERRAVARAWAMRRQMRERADLDRRALEAANGAYRGVLDQYAAARKRQQTAEFDAIDLRQQLAAAIARANAAEAVTAPALDQAHGRLVKLERDVASWEARARGAGWKASAADIRAIHAAHLAERAA